MGWLILLALALGTMGALVLLRLPRLLWSLVGAGLMLGAAGYTLQGRPMLAAHPATGKPRAADDDAGLVALRETMFGRFTADGAYLVAADAMTRAGEPNAAVRVTLGGIARTPRSALLWTGLGTTLAAHDGTLSPPARFAFVQARRLAPAHPGPWFFQGLVEVRDGELEAARASWRRALTLTPRDASYRGAIAGRLALLERLMATGAGR